MVLSVQRVVHEILVKALNVKSVKRISAHGTMLKNSTMEVRTDGR
jgi:hypothetical protein